MDVIAHQAIAQELETVAARLLLEQRQVNPTVIIHEKHILPVVSALRDVMRNSGNHDPGKARHGSSLA